MENTLKKLKAIKEALHLNVLAGSVTHDVKVNVTAALDELEKKIIEMHMRSEEFLSLLISIKMNLDQYGEITSETDSDLKQVYEKWDNSSFTDTLH